MLARAFPRSFFTASFSSHCPANSFLVSCSDMHGTTARCFLWNREDWISEQLASEFDDAFGDNAAPMVPVLCNKGGKQLLNLCFSSQDATFVFSVKLRSGVFDGKWLALNFRPRRARDENGLLSSLLALAIPLMFSPRGVVFTDSPTSSNFNVLQMFCIFSTIKVLSAAPIPAQCTVKPLLSGHPRGIGLVSA